MYRLAVDIGGTFTDVVLDLGSSLVSLKILTTPQSPEVAAMDGIGQLLAQQNVPMSQIRTVIHGTTLATNALIERRGATTALLTTEGFRDVLEMGYEKRFDQYDTNLQLPVPLVPRSRRFTVAERCTASGAVLTAPDEANVVAVAKKLKQKNIEAIAIGFLHSYRNPHHEQLVAKWLKPQLPDGVTVCLSSEVSPEIREYERFSTVCANAYVRPLMSRYLQGFDAALRNRGFAGEFMLMLSGGGLTTLDQAMLTPIRLVESGPAGGVALGSRVALEVDSKRLLALDMGGTTAKICFLENGVADTSRRFEVARAWRDMKGSGLPVRIPTTELVEIGAGGGSIASADAMGRLAVGPESASSMPGPAAYGRGGTSATITDANVVLGRLQPENFAGGAFNLQPELAAQSIKDNVANPLGFGSVQWAAAGILEIGEEAMANAARVHAIERGKDVSQFDLMASGGGGPTHAVRIAEKLGIRRVVIPLGAGVGSAIGFLSAPASFEVARSVLCQLQDINLTELVELQQDMAESALKVVKPALPDGEEPVSRLVAEMRYLGQGHALQIDLPEPLLTASDVAALGERFNHTYHSIYGVVLTDNPLELVALSVTASGTVQTPPATGFVSNYKSVDALAPVELKVFDAKAGCMQTYKYIEREQLVSGSVMSSPLLVSESQTTTVVPEGWNCVLHPAGHLILSCEDTP